MISFLFNRRHSLVETGLLKGAVDQHSHILYGLDDGVKTQEDSLAILGWLEEQGVSEVWFTPHIMEDVPNTAFRRSGSLRISWRTSPIRRKKSGRGLMS